jgi:hypothetical protein
LLCGGGSNLPEVKSALSDKTWTKGLPFARQPDVQFLKPGDVVTMVDETKSLADPADVTPLSLANVGLDLVGDGTVLETMMRKAMTGLKQ